MRSAANRRTIFIISTAVACLAGAACTAPAPGGGQDSDGRLGEEEGVRRAVEQFYAALNAMFTGDVKPMEEIWSHAADVTYTGPDGGFDVGWEKVRANWASQAARRLGGRVTPANLRLFVGSEIAIAQNIEAGVNINTGPGGRQPVSIRATNVFRKENGKWRMIGHHTDILPFLQK